jgi:Uncharacterized paraquat-inducible protein A
VTQHTSCPQCGCTDLIRYSSLNMKQCPDCKTEIPWHLSDGQKPLVGSNRQDRKLNIDEPVSGEDT